MNTDMNMEGKDDVLEIAEWIELVKETIADDWLQAIEGSSDLSRQFKQILNALHELYKPRADGKWNANPKWTDMFQWTSCPLEKVRAVILLKGPITGMPYVDSHFECVGYAGGVRRKGNFNDDDDWQDISKIPSVWNMFMISHLTLLNQYPDEALLNFLKSRYNNGFNPKLLSERGILFLNVALTAGHNNEFYQNEVWFWQSFTMKLLEKVSRDKVPLFQWYITKDIERNLALFSEQGNFVVSKPENLRLGDDFRKHIFAFTKEMIDKYADEINAPKYVKHRAVLREMSIAIVYESEKMSYRLRKRRRM